MKIEDLKGHLLARQGNLDAANQKLGSQILMTKEQLRDMEAQFAGNAGALTEVNRTLALIESTPPTS